MKRKLDNLMLKKIETLVIAKHNIKEISDMLNVSMASVFMAIEEMKQKGIIPLDIEGNDNEEEKSKVTMSQYQAEVKILIDKGMSNKEIAEQLNRSIESVKSAKYQLNKKGLLDGIKNKEKKAVSQKNYTSYREEVKKLLEEGMSNQEIAKKLNRSVKGIINVKYRLNKKGLLNEPQKTAEVTLTSFQAEVKMLLEEGMSNQEIAERLNCSLSSVYNCVNALRKKNALDEKTISLNRRKIKIELQRSVEEKYDSGKTIEEIAFEIGIKPKSVNYIINNIRRQRVKNKNNEFNGIESGDRIKELLEEGATYKEIAQELGFTTTKVVNIIHKMREKRLLDEEKIKESRTQRRNTMQSEIKRLIEEGATYKEIADITGKNKDCIADAIHKLRQEGMLDETKIQNRRKERRISLEKYREQIIDLLNKGYTYNEIKEKLEISDYNIKQYIHSLYKRGLLNSKEIEESRKKRRFEFTTLQIEVKNLLDEGYSIKDIAKKTNRSENSLYGVLCRIKEKEAKKREIIKHIIGKSRSCISKGKYDEAIILLEEIDFEDLEYEKIEKLNKLKRYIAEYKLRKEHDIEMQR